MDFDTAVNLEIYKTIAASTRPPLPDEMVKIFAEIGLKGPFWNPKVDRWCA